MNGHGLINKPAAYTVTGGELTRIVLAYLQKLPAYGLISKRRVQLKKILSV